MVSVGYDCDVSMMSVLVSGDDKIISAVKVPAS